MTNNQCTIDKEVRFSGVGVHSGIQAHVVIKPAPVNTWYMFKRVDLEGQPEILASVKNVVSTVRCTTIGINETAKVSTIEHLIASLYALGIDNAIIEIDGPEVPILDGSSMEMVRLIKEAGIKEQPLELKRFIQIEETLYHEDSNGFCKLIIFPSDEASYETFIDFKSKSIPTQTAKISHLEDFEKELAPCRSFCFFHEIKMLLENNLLQAQNIQSGIVFVESELTKDDIEALNNHSEEVSKIAKSYLKKNEKSILNTELRFENEPARHKLLDVIGDLALIGVRLKGRVIAYGPGHELNCGMAKKIAENYFHKKLKRQAPKIDFNQTPVLEHQEIRNILPHRDPFLFVDKVMEIRKNHIIGIKNVTVNEWFFKGHFPTEPVMPGVLILETMAQVGGILVLDKTENPQEYSTYFLKIENAKFKRKVLPGDTIIIKVSFLSPFRRGLAHMKGESFVGENLVTEADMLAQVVMKNK